MSKISEYIVTFKADKIHPQFKVSLNGVGVRIFAPDAEAVKIIANHRFGNTWEWVHDARKIVHKKQIPGGIIETLLWQEPRNSKIILSTKKKE